MGNQTFVTDTVNNTTRYDYDALNRVITTTNPLGKTQTAGYDTVGNVLTRTDELTQTTRYAYDKARRVVAVTDPLTQTTRYGYDAVGNTVAITNPMTQTTFFGYDAANRMTSKTTPNGTTGYSYYNANNLHVLTDPSGATQTFTYDDANRMTQEEDRDLSGAAVVTYTLGYDPNSNRIGETEKRPGKPDRVTSYSYNKANWLATNTDAGGGVTLYSYDAAGNRTGVSDALGVTTIITPTAMNMPSSTSHSQGGVWKDTTGNTYDGRTNLSGTTTNFTSGYGNFTTTMTATHNANNYLATLVRGPNHASYALVYQDNNLLSLARWDIPYGYDRANRVICFNANIQVTPEFWGYYSDGNRQYHRWGYSPLSAPPCVNDVIPGQAWDARREDYFYTGQKLTRREWGPWDPRYPITTTDQISNYSYDAAGDLTQEVHVDYINNITTTTSYNWTWQAGANRLTTFTASNGVTATFDYDSLGRISRRYNSLGYSDYFYLDGTDWLVRETWHSYVSGNVFNLFEYWYTNGRPSRFKYVATAPSDLSTVWSYAEYYVEYNWHGDLVGYVPMDGVGGGDIMGFNPWGINSGGVIPGGQYYQWNGAWGYMTFSALQMYYVHGRWYRPDIGRFISPNEKGDYLYGGDGNDAVNFAWFWCEWFSWLPGCNSQPPTPTATPQATWTPYIILVPVTTTPLPTNTATATFAPRSEPYELAKMMYYEERSEGQFAMRAVGWVAINSKGQPRDDGSTVDPNFPSTLIGVLEDRHPGPRFEGYYPHRNEPVNVAILAPRDREAWDWAIVDAPNIIARQIPDPTGGAKYFANRVGTQMQNCQQDPGFRFTQIQGTSLYVFNKPYASCRAPTPTPR